MKKKKGLKKIISQMEKSKVLIPDNNKKSV